MLTKEAIKEIEETLGYTFKSKELLTQAFTRSSYAEEVPERAYCKSSSFI